MNQPNLNALIKALRSALHYLYDPVHLRSNPLVSWLGLAEEFDCAAALQEQIMATIRTLKPADDEEPQSHAWRVYDLLHFQYVRQLDRQTVATQLGVSMRQLRREQRKAIEVLAQLMQPQLVNLTLPAAAHPDQNTIADDIPISTPVSTDQALSQELEWLHKTTSDETAALSEALAIVQQLARPLADRWRVEIRLDVAGELADRPVTPLMLRSILLTILSVAIPRAGERPVTITAAQEHNDITIRVIGPTSVAQPPLTEAELASLHTAETLAAFHHARLQVQDKTPSGFVATLTLPPPAQAQVLAIDDNPDWIELQQRYVSDSHYHLVGTGDSVHACHMAARLQPDLILLDVMIRNVDGWQVLSELRHEPATAAVPIVVCTVLPVADLALSLGADAFLQKPVTKQRFLETLARWTG